MRKNKKSSNFDKQSSFMGGYVTLVSILVIGAVGVSVATSLLLFGLGASRNSFSVEQSSQAMGLADACAEEALQQIWTDDTYVGTGNLTLGQGNCSYTVSGISAPKTITASGTVGMVVRKVSIILDVLTPYLNANPWQEVAD